MGSGLSVRKGVLLYQQLISPMMYYTCPVWRSAVGSYIRKLQVLQSKWLHTANIAHWYTGKKQIRLDLEVRFFTDYIVSLRVSTQS